MQHFIEHVDGQAKEAFLRTEDLIPTLDECLKMRRHSGGVYLPFDIIEVALGNTLPKEVYEDDNFRSILDAGNDMVYLANVRPLAMLLSPHVFRTGTYSCRLPRTYTRMQ